MRTSASPAWLSVLQFGAGQPEEPAFAQLNAASNDEPAVSIRTGTSVSGVNAYQTVFARPQLGSSSGSSVASVVSTLCVNGRSASKMGIASARLSFAGAAP